MVWVLVGVRGCVAVDAGHGFVTLLFLSGRLRTGRCISHRGKSQTYYPEHILGYGRLEDLLLSCHGSDSFRTDWLEAGIVEVLAPHGVRDSGCGGLESKFGRRPRHPGQKSDGLVLLVPGVQAGRVFRGIQLGTLIRKSPGNLVRLVCSLAP